EVPTADLPDRPAPQPEEHLAELDEEVARLPQKYRAAVVLCELEGRPRREVAARLGIPEGTLSSRLAHARKVLAARLRQRGVVAPVALFAGAVPALPPALAAAAVRLAGPPWSVPANVAALAQGVLRSMFLAKLKAVLAGLVLTA